MSFEMDTSTDNPEDVKQLLKAFESPEDIAALLEAFGKCSRIAEVMLRNIWDYDDIAVYLKASKHTVINKYTKSDSWPRAVGGNDMKKMYKRDDVIKWAMRRAA